MSLPSSALEPVSGADSPITMRSAAPAASGASAMSATPSQIAFPMSSSPPRGTFILAHAGEHPLHAAHHLRQVPAAHHLHHLAHLLELREQAIDLLDLHARARGDAPLARGLDQLGLAALERRHGVDDALGPAQRLLLKLG